MLSFIISFPDLINFLTLWIPLKDGFGVKGDPKRVTLQIILVFTLIHPKTFTLGLVSLCDRYLHWLRVSVKKKKIYIYIYIYIVTG